MLGLGLLAFGTGLAYRRGNVDWDPKRKVRARDIYAALSVRMGAYAIDLTIVLAAAILFHSSLAGAIFPFPACLILWMSSGCRTRHF